MFVEMNTWEHLFLIDWVKLMNLSHHQFQVIILVIFPIDLLRIFYRFFKERATNL